MRSEQDCGNVEVGFHTQYDGTEEPSTTANDKVTVDMGTANTSYTFDFTTTSSFTAGQMLGFSFKPTNDANDTFGTIVLRMHPGRE